jgi:oligopeptide transport system ATP-binding protein
MSAPLLEVERLAVRLPIDGMPRPVIHEVSLAIAPGEALGLVGESGSGKSMTLRAVIGLLPPGAEVDGDVRFAGRSVRALSPAELRAFRARDVAVVFQDPRAHVNPMRYV